MPNDQRLNYIQKNGELSEALRNTIASLKKVPVMVKPDDSWVVCHIYRKKKKCAMPRVFAQTYNIAGGGQVPFFDFIGQGNTERAASSSSLTGPPIEKENDDTDGSTNEKACSGEGK